MTLCKKGVFGVDELRRGIEALPPDAYKSLSYYEKWARSAAASLTDQGILTLPEIEAALGHEEEADPPVKCALLLLAKSNLPAHLHSVVRRTQITEE